MQYHLTCSTASALSATEHIGKAGGGGSCASVRVALVRMEKLEMEGGARMDTSDHA